MLIVGAAMGGFIGAIVLVGLAIVGVACLVDFLKL